MDRLGEYSVIQEQLEDLSADMGAAEAHGVATGLLCANPNATVGTWLTVLFDTHPESISQISESAEQLQSVFTATAELLQCDQFGFDLLIPDEDSDLEEQADALGKWCQGFLFGLGCAGVQDHSTWPEESQGILKDLSEIAKLDPSSDDQEDDESALAELREYVRVAVQIILMELQQNHTGHQLH